MLVSPGYWSVLAGSHGPHRHKVDKSHSDKVLLFNIKQHQMNNLALWEQCVTKQNVTEAYFMRSHVLELFLGNGQ